ncbi:hypothetical protein [Streptomyces antimycoticus]|uniref:hypothetical protein n=1 Tax=Streptomyces antimycoticus TaxID=68175 RepID=UPI0037FC2DEF
MHRQPELPLEIADPTHTHPPSEPTIDERFEDFHAAHPWILEALELLTARWIQAGGGRIGVKALFEQLRWSSPDASNDRPFRLNNDFTSRYARLLCARHPEWASVFQLRTLRSSNAETHSELDDQNQVK